MSETDFIVWCRFTLQSPPKCGPKMLGRNWGNRPWDHFSHIKPGSWSQKHLHSPSRVAFWPHMEANWTHVLPLQAVETSLLGQFLWAKHNAQFLRQGALFTTYWSEHTLVLILIVHHAVAKVTEHPSHFTADVPAFKAHSYKIQQHTYKCEQTYAQRINDHQARTQCNH